MIIVDDSVGALIFQQQMGISGTCIVDNLNYPLALKPRTLKGRAEFFNFKDMVCTNPSISLYIDAIDGIKSFEQDYNGGLVLSNNLFAKKYDGVDVQLLANTVVDTFISEYALYNMLDTYIADTQEIYIMEPCIHYYRNLIEKRYRDRKLHFLFDYIKREIGETPLEKNRYYVTGKRIGFYMGAEELLGGNFQSTKKYRGI